MTVMIARVSLVAALLLAIALGVQTWRLSRHRDEAIIARAAAQAAALEAAGWQRAVYASQDELARIVPPLKAEIVALQEANGRLALASRWTGRGAAVRVPCPDNMAPPVGAPIAVPPGPPPSTGSPGEPLNVAMSRPSATSADVLPHVKIDDAISLDAAGGIHVARKVAARLSVGETWASEWKPVEPDPDSRMSVDPELSEAWRAWRNPPPRVAFVRHPRLWRFGLACGVGMGYGVVARGVDVTAACVYGVAF